MGRLLEYSVRLVHTPPPSVHRSFEYVRTRQSRRLSRLSERTAALLNVYCGNISGACIDTKPRGMEATCIVCGNGEQLHVRSHIPSASNQNLIAVAWKRGNSNVVRTSLRTQSTTELKQLSIHWRRSMRGIYTGENTWRRKGFISKGAYFGELTVTT